MAEGEYDEAQEIELLVRAVMPSMETERFKYDPAAVRDVVRILRAVEKAEGRQEAVRAGRLDG